MHETPITTAKFNQMSAYLDTLSDNSRRESPGNYDIMRHAQEAYRHALFGNCCEIVAGDVTLELGTAELVVSVEELKQRIEANKEWRGIVEDFDTSQAEGDPEQYLDAKMTEVAEHLLDLAQN